MNQRELKQWVKIFLTVLIVLGFFGVTIGIMVSKTDPSDHDILTMMATSLGSALALITTSWFKNKDE